MIHYMVFDVCDLTFILLPHLDWHPVQLGEDAIPLNSPTNIFHFFQLIVFQLILRLLLNIGKLDNF